MYVICEIYVPAYFNFQEWKHILLLITGYTGTNKKQNIYCSTLKVKILLNVKVILLWDTT